MVMLLLCNPPWRLWPLPPHVILHIEKTEQLLVFDAKLVKKSKGKISKFLMLETFILIDP